MDWVWPAAERAGTPIATMAWRFLPQFRQIAERHPNLKLIIDHCGLVRSAKGDCVIRHLEDAAARWRSCPMWRSRRPVRPATRPTRTRSATSMTGCIGSSMRTAPNRFFWGTDITRMPCSYRQCVTMFTEELPWLKGKGPRMGNGPRRRQMDRLGVPVRLRHERPRHGCPQWLPDWRSPAERLD